MTPRRPRVFRTALEASAYDTGVNTERGRLQGHLAGSHARIAELEALADAMLAKFGEGSIYSDGAPATRSAWVPVHEVATWRAIRHAGARAVAAADELSQLGQEPQGGEQE